MKTIKFLLVIFFSLAVVACGGGGYGSSTPGATGYSISGTVSGGASDHSSVLVNLTGAATKNMTTVAGGSYSFTGLANGTYTVTPSRTAYTFTPNFATVIVYGGNMTQNFTESP